MEIQGQWPKIKEIVGAALEREPDKRNAFLDQVCSQNAALRAEVESLLAAHAQADPLFWSEHPKSSATSDAAGRPRAIGLPLTSTTRMFEGFRSR